MTAEHISFEVRDRVAWIVFNRPDQLNAMNARMMRDIIEALEQVHQASTGEIRVCAIRGEGKAFMAGADIKEYARQSEEEFEDFQARGRTLYAAIENNAKPVIAAVNGYAFGGGFEIALACDMIFAAETARFGLPETLLNLIPGGGGTQRLPRKLGLNRAMELLMTGDTVTAADLERWGLVNRIFPAGDLVEEAHRFAAALAEKEPGPLRSIKQLARLAVGGVSEPALAIENEALGRFYRSPEGQARIQEFYRRSLERRRDKPASRS